jgi:hypothetical protein
MNSAGESPYLAFVHSLAEVISDGRLMGEFHEHVLLVPADLVEAWREIAPNQPVEPLEHADTTNKCIVFDIGDEAAATLLRLRQQRPSGDAISFLTEYYPSVCAGTFTPGQSAETLGPGLIMFQTPRTGSHLMQGMIADLDGFATADEWIRPPLTQAIRLGALNLVDHLIRCARYQQAVHKYWTASIVLPFLQELWYAMPPDERRRLLDFLGSAHAFLLTRRDRVAQTWSQIRATHTGRFHIYSQDDVNRGVSQALQPPEKFWLWCLYNQEQFARLEDFASSLMQQAGGTLPVVAYEELLQDTIAEDTHLRVFGPFYDRDAHRLNRASSRYVRQAGTDDAAMVAQLGRVVDGIDALDFANWRGLERASVEMSGGTVWIEQGRLEARAGTILCEIPFGQAEQPSTVGLQLDVRASDAYPVRLRVEMTEVRRELYSASISQTGGYFLLAPGRVARRGIRYRIGVGGGVVAGDKSARVRLRRLFSVPVDFATEPEFPWMTLEQRAENFALYRLT